MESSETVDDWTTTTKNSISYLQRTETICCTWKHTDLYGWRGNIFIIEFKSCRFPLKSIWKEIYTTHRICLILYHQKYQKSFRWMDLLILLILWNSGPPFWKLFADSYDFAYQCWHQPAWKAAMERECMFIIHDI